MGPLFPGVAIRAAQLRGTFPALRGMGAFLVECFSSNQAFSDNPSRQPQEKKFVNRLFLYLRLFAAPLTTARGSQRHIPRSDRPDSAIGVKPSHR